MQQFTINHRWHLWAIVKLLGHALVGAHGLDPILYNFRGHALSYLRGYTKATATTSST